MSWFLQAHCRIFGMVFPLEKPKIDHCAASIYKTPDIQTASSLGLNQLVNGLCVWKVYLFSLDFFIFIFYLFFLSSIFFFHSPFALIDASVKSSGPVINEYDHR